MKCRRAARSAVAALRLIAATAGASDDPSRLGADAPVARVEVKRRTTDAEWQTQQARTLAGVDGVASLREPPRNRWGGRADRVIAPPGRFRVQRLGSRWILVDPDGSEWYSVGVCSVAMNRTPRADEAMRRRFGDERAWAAATTQLLRTNGFNTLAGWSDHTRLRAVSEPLPYMTQLRLIGSFGQTFNGAWQVAGHLAFSNHCIPVFDPRFAEFARRRAAELLAPIRDDPYCIGHFSDNELPFPADALDRHLALPAGTSGREEAERWVRERGFRAEPDGSWSAEARTAFREDLTDRYFAICAEAIRVAAPGHLYLASRFYGADLNRMELFRAAGRYADVISVNWYGVWTPDAARLSAWTAAAGRPVIITEWYAKGMDSGLDNITGAGWTVRTQRDRGLFYQNFALALLASPDCVGWHWFKYMDNDPSDARADPSNRDSSKGIVSNTDEPWWELLDRMRPLNSLTYALRDHLAQR